MNAAPRQRVFVTRSDTELDAAKTEYEAYHSGLIAVVHEEALRQGFFKNYEVSPDDLTPTEGIDLLDTITLDRKFRSQAARDRSTFKYSRQPKRACKDVFEYQHIFEKVRLVHTRSKRGFDHIKLDFSGEFEVLRDGAAVDETVRFTPDDLKGYPRLSPKVYGLTMSKDVGDAIRFPAHIAAVHNFESAGEGNWYLTVAFGADGDQGYYCSCPAFTSWTVNNCLLPCKHWMVFKALVVPYLNAQVKVNAEVSGDDPNAMWRSIVTGKGDTAALEWKEYRNACNNLSGLTPQLFEVTSGIEHGGGDTHDDE